MRVVGAASVKLKLNDAPLHTVLVCAETTGFGFTFTVTLKLTPEQLDTVGVTV